jgi:DNA-binding NtrC family response regulator
MMTAKRIENARIEIPAHVTALSSVERFWIEHMLQRTGGNKSKASELLGIQRDRIYRKIKKYGIDVKRHRATR